MKPSTLVKNNGNKNYPQVFHVIVKDETEKAALEAFVMLEHAKRKGIFIDFAQSQLSWSKEKLAGFRFEKFKVGAKQS